MSVSRQNGKGSILEARQLGGLFLEEVQERLITHTAHEFKTCHEHFLRLATLVDGLPPRYRRLVKTIREAHGHEAIEMRDGRRIRFLARSGGSGRGFSGDLVVLDEAMILWLAAIAALVPTMAARALVTIGGPQVWYTGSPGLGDDRSEAWTRVRDRGLVGDARLLWAEWAAGEADDHTGDNVDPGDVSQWFRANPAMHGTRPRMELEFVEAERPVLSDNFARERLGVWGGGSAKGAIDPDTWRALGDTASKPVGQVAFAVDVPPEGKSASLARAGLRSDGRAHGDVDTKPGTTWAVERLAEVSKRRNAVVALDGGSRAASLIAPLTEAGVKVVVYGTTDVVRACSGLLDKVNEDGLRHMAQAELNIAVDAARLRKVGDAHAFHRRDTSVNIAPLVALSLAIHALKEEPPRRKTGRSMAV